MQDLFREHWPTSAALYLPGGEVPEPGALFRNPALADTYERLLREAEAAAAAARRRSSGRAGSGRRASSPRPIDRFCRTQEVMDVSGRRHRGVLDRRRHGRLARRPSRRRSPTITAATRCSSPGPGRQGLATLQQLALLKGFDLDGLDPAGPDFIHLQVEAAKLAFADRDTFYGDPAFVEVPVETLLSDAYNAERRRLIGESASHELRPGLDPGLRQGSSIARRGARARAARPVEPPPGVGRDARRRPHGRVARRHGATSTSSTGTAT